MLDKGRYIIVPTSTGCVLNATTATTSDSDGEQSAQLGCGEEAGFSAAAEKALMDVFDSLDADCDGVLSREEVRTSESRILLYSAVVVRHKLPEADKGVNVDAPRGSTPRDVSSTGIVIPTVYLSLR